MAVNSLTKQRSVLVFAGVFLPSETSNYWPYNHARWLLPSNVAHSIYACLQEAFYIETLKALWLSCGRKQKGSAFEWTGWVSFSVKLTCSRVGFPPQCEVR